MSCTLGPSACEVVGESSKIGRESVWWRGTASRDSDQVVGARPVHRTLDAADRLSRDPGSHVAVAIAGRGVPTAVDDELAPDPASPAAF
jgi:hypothetical protein